MQSCAWAGCGANQAQALAAGDTATQHGYQSERKRARVSGSRNLFEPQRSGGELFRGAARSRSANSKRIGAPTWIAGQARNEIQGQARNDKS
jgi:hypothetical protein